MTFPLGSLRSAAADSSSSHRASAASDSRDREAGPGASGSLVQLSNWPRQVRLLLGGVVWLLMLIALVTHSPQDAAFSTSGAGELAQNKAGALGAWLSDGAFFLFGFSVWWLMAVALHRWLGALAGLLRGVGSEASHPTPTRPVWPLWAFWLGIVLLLSASTALEWTRVYHWESHLPGGHAGGVLGYLLGPLSLRWLGFAGSGVLWIAAMVVGLSLAFRFSWLHVADAIGERLDAWRD
ncbi:MAG: DNA translocase FtsK 4TM domain-containing protein, partial [Burkholderiaceae bacterium]|nr:DNA translocase FtsK 4TM domain-containing protein [Burkholderiaceae bacterium]